LSDSPPLVKPAPRPYRLNQTKAALRPSNSNHNCPQCTTRIVRLHRAKLITVSSK